MWILIMTFAINCKTEIPVVTLGKEVHSCAIPSNIKILRQAVTCIK